MSETSTPRPLMPGDRLELNTPFSTNVQIVAKSDNKFAFLQNGTKLLQAPVDAQKGIYKQYWTREQHRERPYSTPAKYRLLTPEYEAEKAAAFAAKVEQIKQLLDKGITETQATQILKILNPPPVK